jgi:hypothetical protein
MSKVLAKFLGEEIVMLGNNEMVMKPQTGSLVRPTCNYYPQWPDAH